MNDHTSPTAQSEHTGQVASVVPLLSADTARPVTKSGGEAASAEVGLSIEGIAGLFEVTGSEDGAMRQLDGVALLDEVRRTVAELRAVSPTILRAALELRVGALRGATT